MTHQHRNYGIFPLTFSAGYTISMNHIPAMEKSSDKAGRVEGERGRAEAYVRWRQSSTQTPALFEDRKSKLEIRNSKLETQKSKLEDRKWGQSHFKP